MFKDGLLKGFNLEDIKRKAKLHDEVTVKIMEIVNENNLKLQRIKEMLEEIGDKIKLENP